MPGKRAESVAVCLLHSYANDAHERQIKEELLKTGVPDNPFIGNPA